MIVWCSSLAPALLLPHVARPSSPGNPYLFQAARYDAETGFYYFRNRFYDPRNGRFLQRDPVWDEQNVGGWHAFVGNSAISRRDPLGLDDETQLRERIQSAREKYNRARREHGKLVSQNSPPEVVRSAWENMKRAEIKLTQAQALLKLHQSEQRQQCPPQTPPPPQVRPPHQTPLPPWPPPPRPPDPRYLFEDPATRAALEELEIAQDWLAIVQGGRLGEFTFTPEDVKKARQGLKLAEAKVARKRALQALRASEERQKRQAREKAAASPSDNQTESCPPPNR